MAKWIVNENGAPGHRWELTVINSESKDAHHLKSSYGWDGINKIIVWSGIGPSHYVCSEGLATKLRRVAQEHADELNKAAAPEPNMQDMELRLCQAMNDGIFHGGRTVGTYSQVTLDMLPTVWAEARNENGAFDSLDMVELMMAVEEEFDVPISEDAMTALLRNPEYASVESVLRWLSRTN